LRPYQTKGLSWLAFLKQFGLGACLADDMGLGKTIQFTALLLHAQEKKLLQGPTLLICPMSVVANWQKEVERFAPSLRVMVHHGADRFLGKSFQKEAKRHNLVITTYALAHHDAEFLSEVNWWCVALDEAQNIKNPSAKQTQAIRKLNTSYRVALTGTPVENRLSELWSIMEFLNPGYLKSAKDFHTNFAIPVEKYHNPSRAERLKRLIQPFVLRRVKTDPTIINDLPEKIETKVFCNLAQEQVTLYKAVVNEMLEKIESTEGIERKGLVLSTLLKLKQVCNHPAQFLQDGSPLSGRSGKLIRLEEMLEEILAEGDKALIFTQFAGMGGLLQHHLQETFGWETLFLHGGTTRKQRDAMIQRFQDDHRGPRLFVLSLKAGGLGLNLTAANHVFHFDRWWNPAVENQATDRVFRIGQQKNVQVHKFVCLGTLEERIDQMIEQKKDLAGSIVGTGEAWLTEMSTEQLKEIFALSREAVSGE
jgi:SNF2 family DNA or RNA helicase